MDWQPIETAPKDGTSILVADADDIYKVEWRADDGMSSKKTFSWCISESDRNDELGSGLIVDEPTHWMPLPQLPREEPPPPPPDWTSPKGEKGPTEIR